MTKLMLVKLIVFYAQMYGISPLVAVSVAEVESNMNHNAIGTLGELGAFQVRPEFVHGYSKTALQGRIGVMVGIQKLVEAKHTCIHNTGHSWLSCYNLGRTKAKTLTYPDKFNYVVKVKKAMKENKYGIN